MNGWRACKRSTTFSRLGSKRSGPMPGRYRLWASVGVTTDWKVGWGSVPDAVRAQCETDPIFYCLVVESVPRPA